MHVMYSVCTGGIFPLVPDLHVELIQLELTCTWQIVPIIYQSVSKKFCQIHEAEYVNSLNRLREWPCHCLSEG